MRQRMSKLMLLAVVGSLMVPLSAGANHNPDADDPNPCSGSIGGFYVSNANHIQIPNTGPGVLVPITDAARGPFYLDVRDLMSQYNIFSIWLYQETNNQNNLQRGGRAVMPDTPATSGDDPCEQGPRPNVGHDQAIF